MVAMQRVIIIIMSRNMFAIFVVSAKVWILFESCNQKCLYLGKVGAFFVQGQY